MISLFDPTVSGTNLGNSIIMEAVDEYLQALFPLEFFVKLPCLDSIGRESIRRIQKSDFVFLGGTNALNSQMESYRQWGIGVRNVHQIRNITLLGLGWWRYEDEPSLYTRKLLKNVLHPTLLHSVRDSYTARKLSACGFSNVLVTGCPTLWKLTQEYCASIPQHQAENVLMTFTDYNQSSLDRRVLTLLLQRYRKVYCWVQGPEDYHYIQNLSAAVEIIPPNLNALDNLLRSAIDLDYVGTRLHAGIRAMQFKRRSIIVGIDNRAFEQAKDFNLPVVSREDVDALDKKIMSHFSTELAMPFDNIQTWLGQFVKAEGTQKSVLAVSSSHPKYRDIRVELAALKIYARLRNRLKNF